MPSTATAGFYTGMRSHDMGERWRYIGQAPVTADVQKALLSALRKVIIPLVQTAVPNAKGLEDVSIGPEAGKLLSALQSYISSVIRGGMQTKKRVMDLEDVPENRVPKAIQNLQTPIMGVPRSLAFVPPPVVFQLQQHQTERTFPLDDKSKNKLEISLCSRTEAYSYFEQKIRNSLGFRERSGYFVPIQTKSAYPTFNDCIRQCSRYAILSHTWLSSSPEVTYNDWQNTDLDLLHEGYRKLLNFCRVAEADYGVTFGWMDTVCIDKSRSSELDESIRSMYKWYQNAEICIVHLAATSSIDEMASDRWFTRGWTLQELLAPEDLKFYRRDWRQLSNNSTDKLDNTDIMREIQVVTGITYEQLRPRPFETASISERMCWAAKRQVTRAEDSAYSLMGVFGVNMSIAYGEGAERAFSRLLTEIINTRNDVLDIFNFGAGKEIRWDYGPLLPNTPKAYLERSDFKFSSGPLIKPVMSTHISLRIPVLLLPTAQASEISGKKYTPFGDYFADVLNYVIPPLKGSFTTRRPPTSLNILDASAQQSTFLLGPYEQMRCVIAVLNCSTAPDDTDIRIPTKCLATIHLLPASIVSVTATTRMDKVNTEKPITFDLRDKTMSNFGGEFYTIPINKLARHGMKFLTMYL
ncbi:hypothetical protein BDN70DRAFT_990510 [Pholiota conissans]|uniref:Heterokaryon incompatibility domain-containing protein n=1 Tax=Pholiota conissans TaxID=109636 RepID=A0A9P6CXU1_9AGAR|nr:hypothetical protein BDN70DRAFT_990510 [Pholiota conissans]